LRAEELRDTLTEMIAQGYAKAEIVMWSDAEGNRVHGLHEAGVDPDTRTIVLIPLHEDRQ
jgi:hypothetical protein